MTDLPRTGLPDLRNKVCLVTGASRGIGATASRCLAASGATVVLAARDVASCEAIAEEIRGDGGAAHGVRLDVTNPDEVGEVVDRVERDHGALHLAFNNAGTPRSCRAAARVDVHRILDVNLLGLVHCLQRGRYPRCNAPGPGHPQHGVGRRRRRGTRHRPVLRE